MLSKNKGRGGKPVAIYYSILNYQEGSLAALKNAFDVIELPSPDADNLEILAQVEVLFAPLGYHADRAKIDACPRLKVVASNTTGHPHIDVDYCREKGIAVACLKFAPNFLRTITPTAELTFGLIVAVARNLVPAHQAALSGQWNRRPFGAPRMLSRMKLGVVGLGRIGSWVAEYGRAFQMEVAYFDPFVDNSDVERFASLQALAAWCDVLTIHVPHEAETEQLIDADVIGAMRSGSYLVNTARGEVVDWQALLRALESGHLAGVGLDVFENEFDAGFSDVYEAHPFLRYAREHPNVVLTPHIGGSTVDAWTDTEMKTIEMAQELLQAKLPG